MTTPKIEKKDDEMSESQMPDMSALLAQAQEMGSKLMAQKEEAESKEVTGSAGGGAVKVVMTGAGLFRSVSIDASVIDPEDAETLEDLVLAALNDATEQAADLIEGPDLGGLNLDSLGGLGSMFGG